MDEKDEKVWLGYLRPETLQDLILKKIWDSNLSDPIYMNSFCFANLWGKIPITKPLLTSQYFPHFVHRTFKIPITQKAEIVPYNKTSQWNWVMPNVNKGMSIPNTHLNYVVAIEDGCRLRVSHIDKSVKLTSDMICHDGVNYRFLKYAVPIREAFFNLPNFIIECVDPEDSRQEINIIFADLHNQRSHIRKNIPPFILSQGLINKLDETEITRIDELVFGKIHKTNSFITFIDP